MARIVFNEALISLGAAIVQQGSLQPTLDEVQATNDFLRAETLIRQGVNDLNFTVAEKLHGDLQRRYSQIICEVSGYCAMLERSLNIPVVAHSPYEDLWNRLVFDQKCITIDCLRKEGRIRNVSEVIAIQY